MLARAAVSTPLPSSNTSINVNQASSTVTPEAIQQFCPDPSILVKDPVAGTWSAPGGWQSYTQSFASSVLRFNGVQWAGIQVGQVICTYQGKEKNTFPIQLVYNKLVLQPTGGQWGKNLGGYINCATANVQDCPFLTKIEQSANVYEEATAIKPIPASEQEAF